MNMAETVFYALGVAVAASPILLLVILGLAALCGFKLSEASIARLTQAAVLCGLLPLLAVLVLMLATGTREVLVELGDWVAIPQAGYHFQLSIIFDRLSIPFAILSFVLCGVVGVFSRSYMHREEGYGRFFLLYAMFFAGMVTSSLAGTIETLFFGWELVGLSSALLVAYFHELNNPVRNGQRIWSIYRIADAAFLVAALTLHHLTGHGDFSSLVGTGPWPSGDAEISSSSALVVGLLLLIAAAGKSALVPFSGWLPRAMEGPTPSSAIFYGSLSVHLGAYLLLRVSPILEASLPLRIVVISVGLISAVSASLMSRVQTDIKGSLAYASLTQVGIIVAEIGFGLHYLALIHIIGHACLRTLQLLRAPSLLLDYNQMENALNSNLPRRASMLSRLIPSSVQGWGYRFGFDRGFMDILLDNWIVGPFTGLFRWSDRLERRWTDWLSNEPSRESDTIALHPESPGRGV